MLSSPLFSGLSALFIGADYGYEFCTDQVRLNANIRVDTPSFVPVSLQLWACAEPFNGGVLHGIKVAEIDCGVLTHDTVIVQTVPAYLPAGTQAHVMELVLVEGDTILSHAGFSQTQTFALPRLQGVVNLLVSEANATVSVEQIDNPRDADNTSGTLVLELWSLTEQYNGGAFAGTQLANAILGVLSGQQSWQAVSIELPLINAPVVGAPLVLMLREWTADGYLTRDYRHLPAVSAVVVEEALTPVVVEVLSPAVEKTAELVEAKAEVIKLEEKPVAVAEVKPAAKTETAPVAKKVELTVNSATLAQLIAEKGISKSIAEKLIAARPYKTWQEVAKVKGIGGKTLAILRNRFGV